MATAENPTLIYLHIPKCAGTTMMPILRANYGEGFYRVGNGGAWRKFHKRPLEQRKQITCLTGHMPWGLCQYVQAPYQHAVMLRNPVDRVVSLYWFVRGFKAHKYHDLARRLSLVEFATSGTFADLDNGMTRWLVGRGDCGALKNQGAVTGADFEMALEHLRACKVVGIVEHFDDGLSRMAAAFGWKHTQYKRKMVNKHPRPTAEEGQILAEYNRWDMAIYRWAIGQ